MREKICVNGPAVVLLRKKHSKLSRQKSLAHELGFSVRTLRKLESTSSLWTKDLAKRLATSLGCTLDEIVFSAAGPKLVPPPAPLAPPTTVYGRTHGKQLYPRFDRESARLVCGADVFFESAYRAERVLVQYQMELSPNLAGHVEELVKLSRDVCRETHPYFMELDDPRVPGIKERMRWLLIWLKGNDVNVFVCDHTKFLPEMDEVVQDRKFGDHQWQMVIAIAPPQEWGETSVDVDVDHGQPYVIDWDAPIEFSAPGSA